MGIDRPKGLYKRRSLGRRGSKTSKAVLHHGATDISDVIFLESECFWLRRKFRESLPPETTPSYLCALYKGKYACTTHGDIFQCVKPWIHNFFQNYKVEIQI